MKQKDIMTGGEADAWLERNRDKLGKEDPVFDIIEEVGFVPRHVLEIGCSNGWRLAKLRDRYGCAILGVEPGRQACIEAAANRVPVHQMTASTLPTTAEGFDTVIYGFCLYLTDPEDWLQIAAEGDRVLTEGGHIIIHDFTPPLWQDKCAPKLYEHNAALISYHFDFSRLWLAHAQYHAVRSQKVAEDETVIVLRKGRLESLQGGL
jgi:SAM-dependent methyltransferase